MLPPLVKFDVFYERHLGLLVLACIAVLAQPLSSLAAACPDFGQTQKLSDINTLRAHEVGVNGTPRPVRLRS
jgi:hypothetical protein